MTWLLFFDLVLQVTYLVNDRREARWLPWWRRYAPSLFIALGTIADLRHDKRLADVAFALWAVAFFANWHSARRNKRNGKDFKAKEAAEAELTQVQQQSFNQQVAEAS